jgi:alkylated DNA repair protein alkB family protein 8
MDAVISIAVIHHFTTNARRMHAIKEILRVLKSGGRACVSVWAIEQQIDGIPTVGD